MYDRDTIAAISTPLAKGAIGIIRVSGPDALNILSRIFKGSLFDKEPPVPRHLYLGTIRDISEDSIVDTVLAVYMKSPETYTGEDVVEIHCHGGLTVIRKIYSLITQCGARAAEPGEFTKRAFMNDRMDLTQAESVIDIIDARTESALKIAAKQNRGLLYEQLKKIRSELVEIKSSLEAAIDFPEDENEILSSEQISQKALLIIHQLKVLVRSYDEGRLYRNGITAAIVGKPNVGKSSLLNTILQENRAIVTEQPGTTRDVIRESVSLNGIPVDFLDTAGIANTSDAVERIGIDRAYDAIDTSDIIVMVLDGSKCLEIYDEKIISRIPIEKTVVVINKSDLPQKLNGEEIRTRYKFDHVVNISALQHTGIDVLINTVHSRLTAESNDIPGGLMVTNIRHKDLLAKTGQSLRRVVDAVQISLPPELIAVDLQAALDAIGEITGQTTTEEILDNIFSKFCIGK